MFKRSSFAAIAVVALTGPVSAADFMEKRECTLQHANRVPIHTQCIVKGGISNGSIDIGVTTPDGKTYPLFGYLDKVDGWSLNRKEARQTSEETGEFPICVKTNDGILEICLYHKV
jgi:hypothetical protein